MGHGKQSMQIHKGFNLQQYRARRSEFDKARSGAAPAGLCLMTFRTSARMSTRNFSPGMGNAWQVRGWRSHTSENAKTWLLISHLQAGC